MRLTKIDIANIKKADQIKIKNLRENEDERETPIYVIELNNRLTISVPYSSISSARRAVKRHTEIEPTTL